MNNNGIPEGWREIDLKHVTGIFIDKNNKRIVITGVPQDSENENEMNHNCDYMRCSSGEHTLIVADVFKFSGGDSM